MERIPAALGPPAEERGFLRRPSVCHQVDTAPKPNRLSLKKNDKLVVSSKGVEEAGT